MTVLWQKKRGNIHYKVTRAGASTRLYTNGIFHSQYNSRQPVAGNLWDLLFLPTLMHPHPNAIERVLVLGVGGGAVIKQLQHFLSPSQILGVDLDPVHLQIARRFFQVTQSNVELIQAEAKAWLAQYTGEPFDVIVEDLFMGRAGPHGQVEPVRAIPANAAWLDCLAANLKEEGVLVMNFESGYSLGRSACKLALSNNTFSSAYRLFCPRYENIIAALLRKPLRQDQFVEALRQFEALDQRRSSCRLQFDWRKLYARE